MIWDTQPECPMFVLFISIRTNWSHSPLFIKAYAKLIPTKPVPTKATFFKSVFYKLFMTKTPKFLFSHICPPNKTLTTLYCFHHQLNLLCILTRNHSHHRCSGASLQIHLLHYSAFLQMIFSICCNCSKLSSFCPA